MHFVPNSHAFWSDPANWTTSFGPAYADITLASSNFVPCRGGPFALCYYSGPSSGAEDLSCTLSADGNYANCNCFDIPYGVYFVDINAILNHAVYEKTVAQCGGGRQLVRDAELGAGMRKRESGKSDARARTCTPPSASIASPRTDSA